MDIKDVIEALENSLWMEQDDIELSAEEVKLIVDTFHKQQMELTRVKEKETQPEPTPYTLEFKPEGVYVRTENCLILIK